MMDKHGWLCRFYIANNQQHSVLWLLHRWSHDRAHFGIPLVMPLRDMAPQLFEPIIHVRGKGTLIISNREITHLKYPNIFENLKKYQYLLTTIIGTKSK